MIVVLGLLVAVAQAQVTREGGVSSVAGTLQKSVDNSDEFVFTSRGSQILFVDLDADIYINQSSSGGHETESADALVAQALSTTEEGCGGSGGSGGPGGAGGSGEDGGCDSGDETGGEEGCGGGGNSRFVLKVLDVSRNEICTATRPTKPGWDTDPRMACPLIDAGRYILSVGFASTAGGGGMGGTPQVHPYLLNISLRQMAAEGTEIQLDKAIKDSNNRLPVKD